MLSPALRSPLFRVLGHRSFFLATRATTSVLSSSNRYRLLCHPTPSFYLPSEKSFTTQSASGPTPPPPLRCKPPEVTPAGSSDADLEAAKQAGAERKRREAEEGSGGKKRKDLHEDLPAAISSSKSAEGRPIDPNEERKGVRSPPPSEKPAPPPEPTARDIAGGRADTRHFLEQATFRAPIETAMSSEVKSSLIRSERAEVSDTEYYQPHPIWSQATVDAVRITHFSPECIRDRLAYLAVRALRSAFDLFSGYSLGYVDERGWLNRIVFLETVAGVPGMVGAMIHHLQSLRRMERDYGWIHTLLEEAENERMHLMTALVLKRPSRLFRLGVLGTQGLFLGAYTMSYLISRRFAHRFVGYLEEEAVITYTKLLKEIDSCHLPLFENLAAPPVACDYWGLDEDATFRDVILAIRADESHHREVNHTFAQLRDSDPNPFPPGH